jgi:hypothetical protein
LHDAKERIRVPFVRALRALGPAQRKLHRARGVVLGRRVFEAFVEHHRNVRAEHALDADRFFRRQHHPVAVHRRCESHAILGELTQRREAEDLEPAGVGEDGELPPHEAVQPAVLLDDLKTGAQPQVERVAEHDLRADLLQFRGRHCLDGAVRADRHERRRLDRAVREG